MPKAARVHSSARGPCPRLPSRAPEPPTSPYLETQKATEASKSLQTPSSDRTRCPHSCQGTQRLCRGLRSAETRGTHGPGAPPSPRLCSRCRLRKGGRIGAQVGSDGSEVRPPRQWHLGSLGFPQTWPESSRIQGGAGRPWQSRRRARKEPKRLVTRKGSKRASEPFPPVPGGWRGGTQNLRPREQPLPARVRPAPAPPGASTFSRRGE